MLWGLLPAELTLWDFLNSQFLNTTSAAIIALVVAVIGRQVTRSNEDVAAQVGARIASEQAQSIEAENLKDGQAPEASMKEKDVRADAKSTVDAAKAFLDKAAKEASDGRHRRTYEALSRYDYVPLAVALNGRGEIDDDQLDAAVALFSLWKQYERGRAAKKRVPKSVLDELQLYLQMLNNE